MSPRRESLRLRSDLAEIGRAAAWLADACRREGVPEAAVGDLELALDEAVSNVIRHGYGAGAPGEIDVTVEFDPERVRLEVRDRAGPFDPLTQAPPPDLDSPIERRPMGGLGVHLMRCVMDRVDYAREAGENRLILERRFGGPGRARPAAAPPQGARGSATERRHASGGSRGGDAMDFTVQIRQTDEPGRGRATVVTFSGRLDSASAPRAEQEVSLALAGKPRLVIFDLGPLRYISSDGLRVLIGARQQQSKHGGQCYFTNLQPAIEKVLEIVKALPGAAFRTERELDAYLTAIQKKVRGD